MTAPTVQTMTKHEREELIRLVKQREKLAKAAAEQRSAAMLAEFEESLTKLHKFNNSDVWQAATDACAAQAKKANEAIEAAAKKLGIPEEFWPRLNFSWKVHGQTEYQQRRQDLRRLAKAEIEAIERAARVAIEAESVQAQTDIVSNGIVSPAAQAFLKALKPIESLMPALNLNTIQQKLAERARQSGGGRHLTVID